VLISGHKNQDMSNFAQIMDFIRSLYPGRDVIPLHEPVFAGNEKKYILDCIDSTFVSSVGLYVDRFEEMIRTYTGAKYAVATVNGTAALHIALLLAGVERGDLVITQPLTFIATCNAITYCGAEPVFIDIDRKTLGLSADALEKWLGENAVVDIFEGMPHCFYKGESTNFHELTRTEPISGQKSYKVLRDSHGYHFNRKGSDTTRSDQTANISANSWTRQTARNAKRRISACVPMHTFGHPCEIDRIVDICSKYYIPVIEDAAESIGSLYKDQHTGTFGLMGVLSFNGNKTITTGGGGMIITNEEELSKLAKHLTTQAKLPHAWKFEHDMVGYNYRLPNINAALGCAQLEKLDEYIGIKREIAHKYEEFFQQQGIGFITEPEHCRSNYWLNAIILDDEKARDEFLKFSNENKVMTRPGWTLMNRLSMFQTALRGCLMMADDIQARLVNIPSGIKL
jgi:perosamine synthetase